MRDDTIAALIGTCQKIRSLDTDANVVDICYAVRCVQEDAAYGLRLLMEDLHAGEPEDAQARGRVTMKQATFAKLIRCAEELMGEDDAREPDLTGYTEEGLLRMYYSQQWQTCHVKKAVGKAAGISKDAISRRLKKYGITGVKEETADGTP